MRALHICLNLLLICLHASRASQPGRNPAGLGDAIDGIFPVPDERHEARRREICRSCTGVRLLYVQQAATWACKRALWSGIGIPLMAAALWPVFQVVFLVLFAFLII